MKMFNKKNSIKVRYCFDIPETDKDGIIFFNDNYNGAPLYREPYNGKVYKIALQDSYVYKECKFKNFGDDNGVLYYVQTNYGKSSFQEYGVTGIITGNGGLLDSDGVPISSNIQSLVGRDSLYYVSDNLADAFIYFYLNVFDNGTSVEVEGVYLKNPSINTYGFLRNWAFEYATVENPSEVISTTYENNDSLLTTDSEFYFPLEKLNKPLSYFSIKTIGPNSIGANQLTLGEIELYGKVY